MGGESSGARTFEQRAELVDGVEIIDGTDDAACPKSGAHHSSDVCTVGGEDGHYVAFSPLPFCEEAAADFY